MSDSPATLLARASRGVAWTLFTSLAAMGLSLVTQVILGWLLRDRDFGLYAIAIALTDFLRVFRDGGVGLWLARMTPDEYQQRAGPAFWLSLLCSLLTGGLLAMIASPMSRLYGEPDLAPLMWILAATFPLGAYTTVALGELQVGLRFPELGSLRLASAVLRYSGIVGLAWFGWGPYSFVIPVIFVNLFEMAATRHLTGSRLWRVRWDGAACRETWLRSRWSMIGSFATAVLRQIDYALYGLIASAAVVGVYFFAYQLTMQLVLLFSESLRRVVLPVFHRVAGQRAQQQRGLSLSAAFLGAVAGPAMFALAIVAPDMEALLWQGRWQSAVASIRILAYAMPLHLAAFFVEMLVQSRGRFRLWTATVLLRGGGLGIAALSSSLFAATQRPDRLAIIVAIYLACSAVLEMFLLLRSLDLAAGKFLGRLLALLTCGALWSAAAIALLDIAALPSPILRIALAATSYAVALLVTLKLVFPATTTDLRLLVGQMRQGYSVTRGTS